MKTKTNDQLISQLQTHPFFANFPSEILQPLAQSAVWHEYSAGEIVVLEGELLSGLYLLQYGCLKVVKMSQRGREQVLRFLESGETFNELGVFANQPIPATVIALEPAGIWLIRQESMQKLLREQPEFAEHLVAKLASHLLYLVSLVSDLSLLPVTGRLAHLLLTEAKDDVLQRPRWYTQAELASRLGTVPDVVQRTLRQLEKDGLIEVQRRTIHIVDRTRLMNLAEQT